MSQTKRKLRQILLGGARQKTPPVRAQTPFVIETMEPRLLLSSVAGLQAIHDNLANMETLIGGTYMAGPLSHTYELVSANGATTAGNISNLKSNFDSDIVSAIAGEISSLGTATTITAAQLQSDLQSSIGSIVGTGSGDSVTITVTDNNTVTEIDFSITQVQTASFTSNFGTIGTHDGVSAPISTGNTLTITTDFALDVTIADNLVASPTPAQEEAAFNLKAGATFDLTVAATSHIAGEAIDVGIMTLTVDSAAAPISESAAFHGAFVALTGTQLAADATAITGGNYTSLTEATPDLAVTQGATTSATIDIPLDLSASEAIPGIATFTNANLVFSGHAVGTDQTGSDAALTTAFQTETGNSSFALTSLNTFLPGDLATELGKINDAIHNISDFSNTAIAIPFLGTTTITSVIDVASAFKTLLIDPLTSTVGAIGFSEGQANAASANFVEGTALTNADLANLPQTIAVQLTLTQPVQGSTSLATQTTSLEFAPTYVNSSGQTVAITTVANLVTALNAAIAASPLAGYVLASNDNSKVDFTLQTPPSGSNPSTADTAITVSSPNGVSIFSNLRSFGIQLATLLQLPGYNDTTDSATTVGNELLGDLGLGYDAANNAITFTISHEFDLPTLSLPASFNLNLGSVANLAINNADFSVVPKVLLNLTVGLSLDPLGSDVNQTGGPVIGDGTNGTTDVALSTIPVVENASVNGTVPLTADAIAAAAGTTPDTGLADLQIINRLGQTASITINPSWTLSNLETAIATAFSGDTLTVTYNGTGNHGIDITDNATNYAGPSPASVGLTASKQAVAAQVSGQDQYDYVATLPGTAFTTSNTADYGQETKFIITLGSLAPFVVDVPAGTTSAATFATALNTAMASINVNGAELGLSASTTLHLSQLVQASVDTDGGVALSTSIYTAIHGALGGDPTTTAQQAAVQWGLSVSPIELTVSDLNGSLMGAVLGITGTDINGGTSTQGLIEGAALDGETLADRLELINTGISATITASLTAINSSNPITVTGALGPLNFTGSIAQAFISLDAALLLDNPADPGSDTLTLHEFDTALADNAFTSVFSFQLHSATEGQPYAELDINNINLAAAGINLTTAASPEIIVTLNNPSLLLNLQTPSPTVVVNGYTPALAAADMVGALQQVVDDMDGGLAGATIPLINISLDQALNFSSQMLVAFDSAGAAGTFSQVVADINTALGGNYVSLAAGSAHDLVVTLDYTPVKVQETLPFSLNLAQLAAATGNSAIESLAAQIASVNSASQSGGINVTEGVTLALTLGINIGGNNNPAALTDKLSLLNDNKGLTTGTAGQNDLQVNFANGKNFQVDVGALASTATVQDLLSLLNTAASGVGVANFATYSATTGALTLTDSTTNSPDGLSDLGLSGATGATTATGYTLTGGAALSAAKAGDAYAFNLNIGNGVTAEVDVAADSTRTTVAELAAAIQTALDETLISAHALLAENGNVPGGGLSSTTTSQVPLGELIDVSVVSGKLVFYAPKEVLGSSGASVLNTLTVSSVTPQNSFTVESINGSHIAQGLGLGSDTNTVTDTAATRSLGGTLTEPGTTGQRFFVETGTSGGALLTGVTATVGISATDLSFTAGIGALSATITNGSAALGADTGGVAAGSPGFAVGNPSTAPATFTIGLNDTFAGESTPGILTFADLAKLGSGGNDTLSNLLVLTYDAAVSVNLPVQVIGDNLGPITLQIGNLFNDPSLPVARTATDSFPSLSGISLPSILNNPQAVIDGLDAFFSILSGGSFAQGVYGLNLPLIGTALHGIGSFFSILHNDVIGTLQSDLNAFIAANPGVPATTQSIVTAGLQGALNELGIGGTIESYVDSTSHPTEVAFLFQFSKTLFSASADLSSNLGIPGLGLNISNGVATVAATLDATIGFGYKTGVGFFVFDEGTPHALTSFTPNNLPNLPAIDFATTSALALQVSVTLASGFTANVSLGILSATAVNGTTVGSDGVAGTNLTGQLIANIGPDDPASDNGLLPFSSFGANTVQAYFNASLNIDLVLTAGIGTTTPSLSLPTITTEVMFAYGYAKALLGDLPDGVASGVTTPLTFMNVSLDLGSFLSNFLKPILDDVEKVIGPLQPILNFLNAPIPGISQIIGNTSILDLAGDLGTPGIQEAVHFIKVLTEVSNIASTLDALAQTPSPLMLDFGNYVLGPLTAAQAMDSSYHSLGSSSVDPFKTSVSSMTPPATSTAEMNMFGAMAASKLNSLPGGSSLNTLQNDMSGSGGKPVISFPILHDPLALVELLMGDITPVSLIQVTLPPFGFNFSKDYAFHFLIGPVPVEVDFFASVGVTINLTFGFDTSGIIRFESSGNVLDIFDGFYILTNAGPELTFTATFGVNAGVDLALVAAGIGGQITGTVSFSLNDPNPNGHLYASDLLHELENNPLDLFTITGELDAKIYAWYWVGIDLFFGKITLFQGQITILDVTLLSFSYDYAAAHSTPILATPNGSTLSLNMGVDADQQENGANTTNANQSFTVTGDGSNDGSVSVAANGGSGQAYTGAGTISADLGSGNNTVIFRNVGENVSIKGGNGNDIVNLGGVAGDPVVALGDGNNLIYGAATDTTVTVGNGNNTIYAGTGRMTINAGDGNNTIIGGTAADIIIVGNGNNTIEGGTAGNLITAGGGNNTIYGGFGHNVISITGGAGQNIIFGSGGPSNTMITATTVSDTDSSTTDGNATITGGNGNDIIFGGNGNNTITAGAGNAVVFGATGTLTRTAAGAIVSAVDTSTTGGNNVINGGAGDTFIIGGAGANTIATGSGNDVVLGNDGTIQGAAGGTNNQFSITGLNNVGGNDTITTGVGTDVVIAGHGANTIIGGTGSDVILGHEGTVVRNAALGNTAYLLSAQTTDTASGGNDLIITGTGTDIVLGGAGNNTIHAGSEIGNTNVYQGAGLDVLIGGFGTVTATAPGTGIGTVNQSFTVTGTNGAAAGHGNDTITSSNTAIIMGGGGNNIITTNEGALASDVIFGANGQVTFDTLLAGGIKVHTAGTVSGEEKTGGHDTITAGNGSDEIFGGAGNSTITAGNGNDVIIGHLGEFNADHLASPNSNGTAPDVLGFFKAQDGTALTVTGDTITAGNGNDVILGGAGNNSITAGSGTDVVFGAAGEVTRNGASNNALLVAQTTEESLGGNNTITVGLNSTGSDVVFGGAGHNVITAGNGSDIILGHIGEVNPANFAYSTLRRSSGARPDIIGRTLPEIGVQVSGEPQVSGLDQALSNAGSTIIAGNGNDIIMGGAGNNTITAGNGNNTVFGASGAVTRDATSLAVMLATTVEEQYAGNNSITLQNGNNTVFGGIGNNIITVGNRTDVIFGHLGEVDMYNTTLYTAAQRAQGQLPDLIGRYLPEIGNLAPTTTAGLAGLDVAISNTTSTITAGNGNDVIFGGAGSNTIVAGLGIDVVFGAAGAVTRAAGTLAPVFMETTEESYGGNNNIYLGLRSTAGDVVFGGIGANNIEIGNGNDIVLGHLGTVDLSNLLNYTSLQRDAGNLPDIWARVVPEIGNIAPISSGGSTRLNTIATTGNDRIVVGNGNNVVMGGGGNNLISTGAGVDVVFGAAGSVSRDARTLQVMYATTVEESLGGNDVLNIGTSARNNDTVFGGAGNDHINLGAGNNVVFGHLGQVDLYAIEGVGPQGADLLGRTIPAIANVSPVSTGPWAGIGHKLSTSGDTITAGNGNNIIEGGAGNNTLNVGNGNNVLVGASASITRNPTTLQEISYTKTEIGLGGTNTYITGTGTNLIINDPISQTVPPRVSQAVLAPSGTIHPNENAALGNTPITQPSAQPTRPAMVHVVSGSHTLASGHDLLQLAMAVQTATPGAPQPASYVLDDATGQWIEYDDDGAEPLLIGLSERPELLLTTAHKVRAAA